jgi:hypothetical protein
MKLIWKVQEAPTGPYRSFEKRDWPVASYDDGTPAGHIRCYNAYIPANVKTGKHGALMLFVADHSVGNDPELKAKHGAFRWRKAKSTFATLKEAKEALLVILEKFPQLKPTA